MLRRALAAKGFAQLTAVQQAVLHPDLGARDLRISSQTGSGKTVAVGMLLVDTLSTPAKGGTRVPRTLVITPTRELATQVAQELSWLLADLHARVVPVTGGTSVRLEQRALARGADVVVGTPGRLLDHLTQKALDPSALGTVVLDEADQMLDLGFRDELESILAALPAQRRTHLVSATFAYPVLELARRYQKDAIQVEGTSLGKSNQDITHQVHVVIPQQRNDALINILLLAPDELTLVFVRTRAEAGDLAERLLGMGFSAAAISGELEQAARTRVMNSFRSGVLKILVATDVAARGIDVPDVTRVVQLEAPKDPDTYTHRSGRTGRAGRKGQSILIIPPPARARTGHLLKKAGVKAEFVPVPDAAAIVAASDARLVAQLTAPRVPTSNDAYEPHLHALATQLLEKVEPHALVHRLLAHLGHHGPVRARTITRLDAPPRPLGTATGTRSAAAPHTPRPAPAAPRSESPRPTPAHTVVAPAPVARAEAPRPAPPATAPAAPRVESPRPAPVHVESPRLQVTAAPPARPAAAPSQPARAAPVAHASAKDRLPQAPVEPTRPSPKSKPEWTAAPPHAAKRRADEGSADSTGRSGKRSNGPWVRFGVSTGKAFKVDPSRVLAMVCRRGNIRGKDVGAIVVGDRFTMFDVHAEVAEAFAAAASLPDPRDPLVTFERLGGGSARTEARSNANAEARSAPARAVPREESRTSAKHDVKHDEKQNVTHKGRTQTGQDVRPTREAYRSTPRSEGRATPRNDAHASRPSATGSAARRQPPPPEKAKKPHRKGPPPKRPVPAE